MKFHFLYSACGFLLLCCPVKADLILDQFYEPPGTNTIAFVQNADWSQTFTVSLTGQLGQIDLLLRTRTDTTEPLWIDIRTTQSDGTPTELDAGSNILGQISLNPGQLPTANFEWVSIDFSGLDVPVSVGDELALVLRTDATNFLAYSWIATDGTGNEYPGGRAYQRSPSTSWGASSGVSDLGFRTYVNISAVPEPASLLLVAMSSVVAIWKPRHRSWKCSE